MDTDSEGGRADGVAVNETDESFASADFLISDFLIPGGKWRGNRKMPLHVFSL
jgi:hypothetical protein